MRYKIMKCPMLRQMAELGQNNIQQIKYLRHNIAVLLENEHFNKFDIVARGYMLYNLMLQQEFELIRFKFKDTLIILQNTPHFWGIEVRKYE